MKTSHLLAAALGLMAMAHAAIATPILVAEWKGNSGQANELADVGAKILAYNLANNPDLPALGDAIVIQDAVITTYTIGDNDKVIDFTLVGYDYAYIMTKWGQGRAGFDHALHYLEAGDHLVYNPGGEGAPNGLSHVSIWGKKSEGGGGNEVPDGGSTVALLGLGLVGLAAGSRRLLRA